MAINTPKVPNNASNAPVSAEITTLKTRIWRHARTKNGYILDISKIPNMTDEQHLKVIASQYQAAIISMVLSS
jgi:hypothetical protein